MPTGGARVDNALGTWKIRWRNAREEQEYKKAALAVGGEHVLERVGG
jgi:hypothetical protein